VARPSCQPSPENRTHCLNESWLPDRPRSKTLKSFELTGCQHGMALAMK
jgi:hypothetical protein